MAITLQYMIELTSDYHSGAGHGLGTLVDAALLRDADGLPVLRGTTITGLLRDGLVRLLALPPIQERYRAQCLARPPQVPGALQFCGRDQPQEADCPLCRLFGSPRTPKRWQISSARPVEYPQAVRAEPLQYTWGRQVVRRARIDPRTRRAEENKLFTREAGDSRLQFGFAITCETLVGMEADIELLVAAARMVRHLGASRRRGQGACSIRLQRVEVDGQPLALSQDAWLERFAQRYLHGQEPTPLFHQPSTVSLGTLNSTGTPRRFWLLVRTEEPLLVAERSEAANQFDARPIIPGSTVRGALAARIAARQPQVPQGSGDSYEAFVALCFRHLVRFPMLYPAQTDARGETLYPMLPAPRDLLSCELYPGFGNHQHGARGYATATVIPECSQCPQPTVVSVLKPLGDTFLPLRGSPVMTDPHRATEMHITLHPDSGRVRTGALYGYVALETGQYFVGELWCANAQAWEALRTLADLPEPGQQFPLRLGKATRRGYGQTTAWLLPQEESDQSLWLPTDLSQRLSSVVEPFTLTLLTDTILQDPWGRFHTHFDAAWLTRELGFPVEIKRQFVATAEIDTFNAHLGLPRQRDIALRAGSAVGLWCPGTPPADWQERLTRLERDGLGLRRHEGFGRVAFNHTVYQGNREGVQFLMLDQATGQQPGSAATHPLRLEAEFQRRWEDILRDTAWSACKDSQGQFVQVGRLLHASQHVPVTALSRLLDFLGQEALLLGHELQGRQKTTFFQDENQGKRGVQMVQGLLEALRTCIASEPFDALSTEQRDHLQQLGLTMLAAKVAEVASQARQSTSREV